MWFLSLRRVDPSAFSVGQIQSKLWLCEELESIISPDAHQKIAILGSWYSILAFLIFVRNRISILSITSYDLDKYAQFISNLINKNWRHEKKLFNAICMDINKINFKEERFSLIINTSVEHMESLAWWENIPEGTRLALMGNNLDHSTHIRKIQSLEQLKSIFNLRYIEVEKSMKFNFPEKKYERFLIIGIK